MVCSTKTSFYLFWQMGPNDPVQGRLVKRPLFLFLMDKRAHTYPVHGGLWFFLFGSIEWVRVLCACSVVLDLIRFDETRGLRRCQVFVVMPLVDNVVLLQIKKIVSFPLWVVTHVSLTEEYSTILWSWLLHILERPSVNLMSGRVIMHIFLIGSWCAGSLHRSIAIWLGLPQCFDRVSMLD